MTNEQREIHRKKRVLEHAEPDLEGAFSEDGVDLTLIRWMLRQTPTERLRAAQQLIDTAWALRDSGET